MAKADKNGHSEKLSIQQWNAIDLLASGRNDQETADAIGRTRQTVSNWRLHHPRFQSSLNQRRNELWESATDKLRTLVPKALAVLERELDGGDHSVKAALAVVKMVALPIDRIGAQDPDVIIRAAAKRQEEAVLAGMLTIGTTLDAVRADLLAKAHAGDAIEIDGTDV